MDEKQKLYKAIRYLLIFWFFIVPLIITLIVVITEVNISFGN